jgi:hypothetical protein
MGVKASSIFASGEMGDQKSCCGCNLRGRAGLKSHCFSEADYTIHKPTTIARGPNLKPGFEDHPSLQTATGLAWLGLWASLNWAQRFINVF